MIWLSIASLILLVVLSAVIVFAGVCFCAHRRFACQKADCLIVLGARVHPDGQPSTSLEMRCRAAAEAFEKGIAGWIIVCGGRGADEPVSEARAMDIFLRQLGVDESHILLEDRSTNTLENLHNACEIMNKGGFKSAVVVTSDYHLTRALWLARDLGIPACGIAARGPLRPRHVFKSRIMESGSWLKYFFQRIHIDGRNMIL